MMGGEVMNKKASPIFEYLKLRQDFENTFPGYESDIHGVERIEKDGKKYFKTLCVKK
jgi:lysine decarboxylase/arginine decarboxylase